MGHYGIGELTAVTILAELGDCRRFSSSRHAVRYSGLDITVHQSDQRRAPGHLSRQGPPALRWALFEAAQVARRTGSPDREYYPQAAERLGAEPRLPGDRAQAAQAQLPHAVRARRGGAGARLNPMMRAQPFITPMHRGRLPTCSRRHARVDGPERPSGRTASSCGITPSTIMSPTRSHPGPRTEIRLGARAHTPVPASAATAPVKRFALGPPGRPRGDRAPPPTLRPAATGRIRDPQTTSTRIARLPRGRCTDKEQPARSRPSCGSTAPFRPTQQRASPPKRCSKTAPLPRSRSLSVRSWSSSQAGARRCGSKLSLFRWMRASRMAPVSSRSGRLCCRWRDSARGDAREGRLCCSVSEHLSIARVRDTRMSHRPRAK